MFGSFGAALQQGSLTFVSQSGQGNVEKLGLAKTLVPVKGCRSVKKVDMLLNNYLPTMEIDAQTYEVRADGVLLTCEPAKELPMAQRYFLF
jgi:urease subunit alpha